MPRRFKATVEYDGSKFYGMQKQPDPTLPTIQFEIEAALSTILRRSTKIEYAGRTDAGVHAIGQVVHFDADTEISCHKLSHGANHFLEAKRICVLSCEDAPSPDFHSRFSAKTRHYSYFIKNRRAPLTFESGYKEHIPWQLNLQKMERAGKMLIGRHDFASFCSKESSITKNTNITLSDFQLKKDGDDDVVLKFSAKSFLHNMVRIMVGTLIDIGSNEESLPEDILHILNKKDRCSAKKTAFAGGLYFTKVDY